MTKKKNGKNVGRKRKSATKPTPDTPQTSAIVKAPPAEQLQLATAVPSIREMVTNFERVRGFITRCMNTGLQKRLAKLQRDIDAGKLPKDAQLDRKEREKLEIDYGTIPGVDKPFLKQPGAEKFLSWLNLRPNYIKREIDLGGGHLEMVASVKVFHKKTGQELFEGPDCSCSTMESNYRFRFIERDPPYPSQKDSVELKKKGLGKWRKVWVWSDERGKKVETWVWFDRAENPNIHDERNKVRQMAEKRALVKCVRNMGALSEIFTEDPAEWGTFDEDEPTPEPEAPPSGRVVRSYEDTAKATAAPAAADSTTQNVKPTTPTGGVGGGAQGSPSQAEAKPPATAEVLPKEKPVRAKPKKIEVFWGDERVTARVAGDFLDALPDLKKRCPTLEVHDGQWSVLAADVPNIEQLCMDLGFQFHEVEPNGDRTISEDLLGGTAATVAKSKPKKEHKHDTGAVITAVIKKVSSVTKGAKSKFIQVLLNGVWHYCFNPDLFDYLGQGLNLEAELYVNDRKPPTIEGIKRIGTREFVDGKVPAIQVNEERPKPGNLFT